MASSGNVEHAGIISLVSDKFIRVSIIPESACGSCRARGSCSVGEKDEKIIEVPSPPGEAFNAGEKIKVILEQSLGLKALWLGYILPFILLMLTLIVLTSIGLNEGLAGLFSLLSLAPYYLILSFFKETLKKEFTFRLKKL